MNEDEANRGVAYALQMIPVIGIIAGFIGSTHKRVSLPIRESFAATGIMEWAPVVNKVFTMVEFTRKQVKDGLLAGLAAIHGIETPSPMAIASLPSAPSTNQHFLNMLGMTYTPTRGKYVGKSQNLYAKGIAQLRQENRIKANAKELEAVITAGGGFVVDGVNQTVDGVERLRVFTTFDKAVNGAVKKKYGANWWDCDKLVKMTRKAECQHEVRPFQS